MICTMDDYLALDQDRREIIEEWVYIYVPRNTCFAFELAADGAVLAARFHVYKLDTEEISTRAVDVFPVDPCPWPFR